VQIHRIQGRSLREALERARKAHGDTAVVLGHEAIPGGGVTVSVSGVPRPSPGHSTGARHGRPVRPPGVPTPLEKRPPAPAPGFEETDATDPGIADVRRRMAATGSSPALIASVVEAVERSGKRGAYAIDAAAASLGRLFEVAPSPRLGDEPRVIAFVGPTGVGKTTTLAKLGLRLVQSGRRVALATLDTYRVGAVDQLRAYADALQVPLHVVRRHEDIGALMAAEEEADVVLLDTTGRSPRDRRHLQRLQSVLDESLAGAALDTYLVVSATTELGGLAEVRRGFDGTRPSGIVVTKLDETGRTAVALEHAHRTQAPIAFLCDGQDVREHLHRPDADRLADLVLRGALR